MAAVPHSWQLCELVYIGVTMCLCMASCVYVCMTKYKVSILVYVCPTIHPCLFESMCI